MIKGIPVTIHVKQQTGVDDFGLPAFGDSTEIVDNVLVGEPSAEDITNATQFDGKRLEYILAIPKKDNHTWENTVVEFYGKKFRTFGLVTQGIEANIPLAWNKKVKVERYE